MGTAGGRPAGDPRNAEFGRKGGKGSNAIAPTAPYDLGEIEEAPAPPPALGLRKRARRIWHAFWESSVSKAVDYEADQALLSRWISGVNRWHRVLDAYNEALDSGLLVVPSGTNGALQINPLSAELNRIEKTILGYEKELGLTPMSRARLGLTVGEGQLVAAQLNAMVNRAGGNDDAVGDVIEVEGW